MLSVKKKKVGGGFYSSTSELIRSAVRLWQQREEEYQERLKAIRMRLEHSERNGDPVPLQSAFEIIENLHKQSVEKSTNG